MKILALTILFILMFFRIKGTPNALSKTLWRKRMIKQLTKNKENNNKNLSNLSIVTFHLMDVRKIITHFLTSDLSII